MNRLIYTFRPVYKSTLWGGDRIASYKGETVGQSQVGESWEISAVAGSESAVADGPDSGLTLSELCDKYGAALLGADSVSRYGATFPLLVKIIDARQDLSVQVHPDDVLAKKRHGGFGKTEMWYVVDTEGDARIACGLSRKVDPASLEDLVARGEFRHCLASHRSAPGDCFFIPAGRVHSIGAGNLLVEIQQSSDITYRIDDFGRRDADGNLRQLHIDLAKDAIDYSVKDDYRTRYEKKENADVSLVDCQYFKTDLVSLSPRHELKLPHVDSFRTVVCMEGEATVSADGQEPVVLRRGHSALVAAEAVSLLISAGNEGASLLVSHV